MASKAVKRVSSSAVDWARFAAVIPKVQIDTLRNIKTKHDTFLNKVHQLPENLPKIDFSGYKSRLPDPSMADRFQKAYEALSIPYPVDKDHFLQKVEAEREEQDKVVKQIVTFVQKEIDGNRTFISKIDTLPKYQDYTRESFVYYFPDTGFDPQRPTIWPHHEEDQPYVRKEGEDHH
ncbi:unnamed protein product [Candidula unifasciata]|uniref:ATP synthase subunit d, mitochondrial n=1 Tax=Candidula unifasciata TaxID=100452 RepID=A0A8S3ZLE7_9EUPU|nr:unnamed protein product [Candidula unifasciata]